MLNRLSNINSMPFFHLAFRPLFLLPAVFSVAALLVWSLLLQGNIQWHGGLPANIWHGHEMIFGFAAAIAVGFLLTAAQTWTGIKSISGVGLAGLVVCWLLARILLLANTPYLLMIAVTCQMLFWLISIAKLAHMILVSANKRNIIFLFLLTGMALLDLASILLALNGDIITASHLLYTAVLMMTNIVTVLGGRVIPFFTTRGLKLSSIDVSEKIEKVIFALMAIQFIGFVTLLWHQKQAVVGIIFVLFGFVHLLRMSQWHSINTLRTPLLWSLHLSYLNMAVGFILVGISYFFDSITFSAAMHLITVGTIGMMIIAMMSRVALGHTGRALAVGNIVSAAFALLLIAALARALLPLLGQYMLGIGLATTLWIAGFTIFVYAYAPILLKARPAGRGG